MKKLLYLLIPVIIVSCSSGPNKITDRHLAQTCNYSPLTDSINALIFAGFAHADLTHAGNPLICDSVYTVSLTLAQKWSMDYKWCLWIGLAIIAGVLIWFIKMTSSGSDSLGLMVPLLIGLAIGCGVLSGFFYFNDYRDIRKADYVHYMNVDGNLDNWWKLPAQSY